MLYVFQVMWKNIYIQLLEATALSFSSPCLTCLGLSLCNRANVVFIRGSALLSYDPMTYDLSLVLYLGQERLMLRSNGLVCTIH